MPNKYSDFIEIDPSFESVVDIEADSRNKNLWSSYIVGDDMKNLMEKLCLSINWEEPDTRRSFWVEGTYGTGKSYAAILVKHLMEDEPESVRNYLSNNAILSAYCNRFMKCRDKEKGDYLVIWKVGCTDIHDGSALLMEIEMSVRAALKRKFGDNADYGENSLQDIILQQLDNPAHNWNYIIKHTTLSDHYDSVDALRESIEYGDIKALQNTAAVIRSYGWGLIDSLETFKKWMAAVIENNGLSKSGIFFIWDEFTEYVANSDDHIILQQLSEYSKVQPFFMLFIVHRTKDMIDRITPQKYEKITDRFHSVEFHINSDMAFDLISGSIKIKPNMEIHWQNQRETVINAIWRYMPDISGLDEKITNDVKSYCPMHPMTIKLLSRVAQNYAASQRTMFRFMKDKSNTDLGFAGYINKYGPDDQACWLTPDWLWDYFFTRTSDFADKDVKAAEYIHHYEESRHLVESDENAFRIFKAAMLLLAVMSSTKGIYGGKKAKDGISATKDCLEMCFAGVIAKRQFDELLQTIVDSKILVLDEGSNNIVRLQLPFRNTGSGDFTNKFNENDKKYSRYNMFAKDGVFSQEMEKYVWRDNDDYFRRMKVAVCCGETLSINNRLAEVNKELEKCPYKLGLLVVIVQNEAQHALMQTELQRKAANSCEPRLTIALVKNPLTDETRTKWIRAITNQEMAAAADQSGSASQYKQEAATVVASWAQSTVQGSRIVAYNGDHAFSNLYGMANLRKEIENKVMRVIFKYAPENIVVTGTVYKPCTNTAPQAGVERNADNNQFKNVLLSLNDNGLIGITDIAELASFKNCGIRAKESVAAAAEFVKNEMESGHKVNLSDIWASLQQPPFGYYNTIACGILLGYIFSFYKNSKYTWTDSMRASHVLSEGTLSNMVYSMCTGKTTTDYLSAGSLTWQKFSAYLARIFNLSPDQLAEQTTGYQNVREAVTKNGAPFWALKYLPDGDFGNENLKMAAVEIIDKIQLFIIQEGNIDNVMNEVLTLFEGRGKLRNVLVSSFNDKNVMAAAFRTFLFTSSPELEKVAVRLSVQPEELSDKLHEVMQGSIYTWTEDQVKEKLADVTNQYRFIEAIGKVQGVTYHSIQAAKKDLCNLFGFLKVPMAAIAPLNKPWYPALHVLYNVAFGDTTRMGTQERESAISSLNQYGSYARDCLKDGKFVLDEILSARNITCTAEELAAVYSGLGASYLNCDSTLTQFNNALDAQLNKISAARNRSDLLELWRSITGEQSIKSWCNTHGIPLMCIIRKEDYRAFSTLLDAQNGGHTVDSSVVNALNTLRSMDISILTDNAKMQQAFISAIGCEYEQIFNEIKIEFLTQAKLKLGSDMSQWTGTDLTVLQSIIKKIQQEKAKREKLAGTKNAVLTMQETLLKDKVTAFLDAHPEFCDEFMK